MALGVYAPDPRPAYGASVGEVTADRGSTNSLFEIVVILCVLLICVTIAVARTRGVSEKDFEIPEDAQLCSL